MKARAVIAIAALAGVLLAAGIGAIACRRGEGDAPPSTTASAPSPPSADEPFDAAAFYAIDATALGKCTPGAECAAVVRLTTQGGYHINEDYPMKLVSSERTDGVEIVSKPFIHAKPTAGTLPLRFTPKSKGTFALEGTFRFAICDADRCVILKEPVRIATNAE